MRRDVKNMEAYMTWPHKACFINHIITSFSVLSQTTIKAVCFVCPAPISFSHLPNSLNQMHLFTLLSLLLFFIISPSNESMDPNERETLFKVMESISSDRNWRSSSNPCSPASSWPGLECKPLGDDHQHDNNLLHVTRLGFGNSPNNPTCKSTATFPSELFHLPHLQSLFIFNCFITTNTSLSIPNASSSSLEQLSLKSNPALVGRIPAQISSLTSLKVLTLSQNRLHGDIPQGISTCLTSLVHLDLSYNSLSGPIPAATGGLRSLSDLDLSYNSLTGPIPASIGQMGLLQKLDLSNNSLSGDIPGSLGNLTLLTFLALSNNKLRLISGELPKSLEYLIMDDNPVFVPLPFQLGGLPKLQELRLANSGYSGSIPESFALLTNLTTLSLENNKLSGEIPQGLSDLGKIYHMNLSRNCLGGVVPFGAGFIRRLGRNLDLSGNSGLCVDGSERFEGIKVGVTVCGADKNSSSSSNNNNNNGRSGPAVQNGAAASLLFSFFSLDLLLLLGFVTTSVMGLHHWLL